MFENWDSELALHGILQGALFCMDKPITDTDVFYVWQHILWYRCNCRRNSGNKKNDNAKDDDDCSGSNLTITNV